MQTYEAVIERERALLARGLACDPARAAAGRLCEASTALCREQMQLDDHDAAERCLAARDSCSGAHGRTREACATSAP